MICADRLGIRIGRRWLLQDVSLTLQPGTLTAVLGPNGAGKTTLLRALNGELTPDAGTVTLDGAPIRTLPGRILARRRAVLSQGSGLAFGLTVEEVVALGRLPHAGTQSAREDHAALAAVRGDFGLAGLWTRPFPTLSGGERQRVQLARAAAQLWRPDGDQHGQLLFLDEPAAALDLAQQARALRFAQDAAARGAIASAVLHDLEPCGAVGSRRWWCPDRARARHRAPDAVLTEQVLAECYGTRVERVVRTDGPDVFLPAWCPVPEVRHPSWRT